MTVYEEGWSLVLSVTTIRHPPRSCPCRPPCSRRRWRCGGCAPWSRPSRTWPHTLCCWWWAGPPPAAPPATARLQIWYTLINIIWSININWICAKWENCCFIHKCDIRYKSCYIITCYERPCCVIINIAVDLPSHNDVLMLFNVGSFHNQVRCQLHTFHLYWLKHQNSTDFEMSSFCNQN